MGIEYEVIKDIGVLTQRMNHLENTLMSIMDTSPVEEPVEFDDLAHRLSYPVSGKVTSTTHDNTNLCRVVQESVYDVEILKTNDGIPALMKSEMTRVELDDFIAKNPGRNFSEFIVSVSPSYKEYL
jgi:hypothetical protein